MVNYCDYDRIADTILFLDNIHTLEFVTRLATKDKNGYRRFFEYETEYSSNQFIGIDKGRSIKRSFMFYYCIQNRNQFESSIILVPNDVFILKTLLKTKAIPWFFGENRIYKEKDNNLIITGNFDPIYYIKDQNHFISFEPITIKYEDETFKEGVRLTLPGNDYVDITLDKFLAFYTLLNAENMYNQSLNQVNYVKTAPYETNKFAMTVGLGSRGSKSEEPIVMDPDFNHLNNKTNFGKGTNSFLDNAKKKDS